MEKKIEQKHKQKCTKNTGMVKEEKIYGKIKKKWENCEEMKGKERRTNKKE